MEIAQTERGSEDNGKRELASYPYMGLAAALRIADAVKDLGGAKVQIQKSLLASHLEESEKSASFQQKISASKSFGIIEGRSDYSLSESAKQYYFPTGESDRTLALLGFLASPSAFSQIIKRFDGGKLPPRQLLANILHRELRVPASWKDRVAAFFQNAAELVGCLDSSGFLRFRALKEGLLSKSRPGSNVIPMQADKAHVSPSAQAVGEASHPESGIESNVWNFSFKGKAVRLSTPSELDSPLWEKLNAYVQLLKPVNE